jgi:hypothetical protein
MFVSSVVSEHFLMVLEELIAASVGEGSEIAQFIENEVYPKYLKVAANEELKAYPLELLLTEPNPTKRQRDLAEAIRFQKLKAIFTVAPETDKEKDTWTVKN